MSEEHWLQPDGIDSILPAQAFVVESLRRELLDSYQSWGYDLVIPPFLDYLPSLLTGSGTSLEQKTFKFVDPLTGKMVGIRADMTPQVARIDAHELGANVPVRLSYIGNVLHTSPDGFGGARSLLQLGVELYGEEGVNSDVEVLMIMLNTLAIAGVENTHIDLGHVGIFRALARQAKLSDDQEIAMHDALQRKAIADIQDLVVRFELTDTQSSWFLKLITLNGDESVLVDAVSLFEGIDQELNAAIAYLQSVASEVKLHKPDLPLYFDLAELRGYHYHTGVVFAAFVPGHGRSIARGGRYDEIGKAFGRARPATGFSTDLKTLVNLSAKQFDVASSKVYAPYTSDRELQTFIDSLRASGQSVVQGAEVGSEVMKMQGCGQQVVQQSGKWVVESLI
ncbi:MAG: ATP phosphoribosyltransferase regulatory subunit [Methylococcales bacterium]|nr:ATP phosphoribosyltransferase regulatory subunit [Methylococcales bacterium]